MNNLDEYVEYAKEKSKKYPGFEKEVFQAILISKLIAPEAGRLKSDSNQHKIEVPIKKVQDGNYQGLTGGIRLLIKEGFLDEPKSVNDVWKELRQKGYHYSVKSLDKLLRVNFTKDKKSLNRIKEDNTWRYVIRK